MYGLRQFFRNFKFLKAENVYVFTNNGESKAIAQRAAVGNKRDSFVNGL